MTLVYLYLISGKKTFTMAVELEGTVLGTGTGNSKQSAGQAAAKYALEQMGESI